MIENTAPSKNIACSVTTKEPREVAGVGVLLSYIFNDFTNAGIEFDYPGTLTRKNRGASFIQTDNQDAKIQMAWQEFLKASPPDNIKKSSCLSFTKIYNYESTSTHKKLHR